jgi:hypothetical protein
MYVFLVLFVLSFTAITYIVRRKIAMVKNGWVPEPLHPHPFVPDMQKLKHFTVANARRMEHMALVTLLRSYVKTLNLLKSQYRKSVAKLNNLKNRNKIKNGEPINTDASKFLKMVSDYKHKIRTLKRRIHEEENKM